MFVKIYFSLAFRLHKLLKKFGFMPMCHIRALQKCGYKTLGKYPEIDDLIPVYRRVR